MVNEKLKEQYESFDYGLPSYEDLEMNFEIANVEDVQILRGIRKKMCEKLESYCKLIEELIQPDASFSSMYEIKDLTEDDKLETLNLFKSMMLIYKEGVKLNLNFGEKDDADYIKKLNLFWIEAKDRISKIIDKVNESWKDNSDEKMIQEYFG